MIVHRSRGKAIATIVGGIIAAVIMVFIIDRCTRVDMIIIDDSMFQEIEEERKAREAAADKAVEAEREQARINGLSIPPKPKGNAGSWIQKNSYPSSLLKAGVQGTVSYTLTVNEKGINTNCEVTKSSGSRDLDSITCSKLRKFARFYPALKNGRPIPSTYSNRVRWVIPKD